MKHKIYIGILSLVMGAFTVACDDDDDYFINETPIVDNVVTGDAVTTATTATITGSVSGLAGMASGSYAVGVVYSTTTDPTVGGSRVSGALADDGMFTATISNLPTGATYYYASFVTLQGKVSYYGDVKSFVTTDALVATADPQELASTYAILGGTLNGVGDKLEAGTVAHGIALAPTADMAQPVSFDCTDASSSYSVKASALVPNTTYYYAAYMVINDSRVYGDTKTFATTASGADASVEKADFVDMGTSKEWARYNVGAAAENQLGGLYGYGDVKGLNRSTSNDDYASGNIAGTSSDIAKAAGMGFVPTVADWEELIAASTIEEAEVDGVKGVKFTSRSTGNSVFFPAAGARQGNEVTEGLANYWTSDADHTNADYAYNYALGADGASKVNAPRCTGLAVRAVRNPYIKTVAVDNSKIVFNNKDGNGVDGRIEIYNEYGPTGGANSPVNLSQVKFGKNMAVTFTIEGIDGNLKEGAAGSYKAELSFADASWDPSYWGGDPRHAAIVGGNGTYTVSCDINGDAEGAVVWCVELYGLWADLADTGKVKVTVDKVVLDSDPAPVVAVVPDSRSGIFNNKDGNGVDGRIEIFNEYGDTKALGVDYSSLAFPAGTMAVTFTVKGIDGNLKEGAAGSYKAELSFADASWDPSYWGGMSAAAANVTADGTYTVLAPLGGDCEGAVVWCVELYGLWQDLADNTKVTTTIDAISVPGKKK